MEGIMYLKNIFFITICILTAGCAISPNVYIEDGIYSPDIDPDNFVDTIVNPYMPLVPGTVKILAGDFDGVNKKVVIIVTEEKKQVMGINCTVVEELEYENGVHKESTQDWFAQDIEGNVWYFGEITAEYKYENPITYSGSWEAGVDDALPGIVMPGNPSDGDKYYLEYYPGKAEEMIEVIEIDRTISLFDSATYENCIVIKEWSPLEMGVEYKYYARGLGLILIEEPDREYSLSRILTIEEYEELKEEL
jgi:hypothetical protein